MEKRKINNYEELYKIKSVKKTGMIHILVQFSLSVTIFYKKSRYYKQILGEKSFFG